MFKDFFKTLFKIETKQERNFRLKQKTEKWKKEREENKKIFDWKDDRFILDR